MPRDAVYQTAVRKIGAKIPDLHARTKCTHGGQNSETMTKIIKITCHLHVMYRKIVFTKLTCVRDNLTGVTLPPNSTPRRFLSCLLLTLLLYCLFISYLPRCILPGFSSVSSLTSLPFLYCCHRTTTIRYEWFFYAKPE